MGNYGKPSAIAMGKVEYNRTHHALPAKSYLQFGYCATAYFSYSFVAAGNHTLENLRLYLNRDTNTIAGTLVVSLYNADALGKPTGAVLDSVTISNATISALDAFAYENEVILNFTAKASLVNTQKYVIVLFRNDLTAYPHDFGMTYQYQGAYGIINRSDDGTTWAAVTDKPSIAYVATGINFEVYGKATGVTPTPPPFIQGYRS